jgi:hypothetical protein
MRQSTSPPQEFTQWNNQTPQTLAPPHRGRIKVSSQQPTPTNSQCNNKQRLHPQQQHQPLLHNPPTCSSKTSLWLMGRLIDLPYIFPLSIAIIHMQLGANHSTVPSNSPRRNERSKPSSPKNRHSLKKFERQ